MNRFFRNIMLFGIATAMLTACGDEPEVTKKDTSDKQKEQGNVTVENGAIKAAFSVSDSKQVYFSQGNLQYQASTGTWRFAENQWDFVGTQTPDEDGYYGGTINGSDNANISETYEGWIDLFGWGTSGRKSIYYPYSNNNYAYAFNGKRTDIAGTNYDWGVYNEISNGGNQAGMWRTLTYDEWHYLRYGRTDADALYGTATVNGVDGCVFLPDNWTTPTGVAFKCGANGYSINTYTVSDWAKMEANGAVFLPAAGHRFGTDVRNVGSDGYYWSGSANGTYDALDLYFDSNYVDTYNYDRRSGQSVRLVRGL